MLYKFMKPIKALFITEKYQSLEHKNLGFSNSMHNIIGSWQCAEFGPHEHLFLSPDNGDIWSSEALIQELEHRDYTFAILSGNYRIYPDRNAVKNLMNRGRHLGMVWWDTIKNEDWQICKSFADVGMQQLVLDQNLNYPFCSCLETPQDTRLFFRDESQPKDIDVSFIGSIHNDRKQYVDELQRNMRGLSFLFNGGRGHNQGNIPLRDYAAIHRRSKVCLNFQLGSPNPVPQRKGRSYEVAASGGFLMSNLPEVLNGWFTDGEEYISFNSPHDLIAKVRRYLDDPNERNRIADNAYKRFCRDYSPKQFWSRVLNIVGVVRSENSSVTSKEQAMVDLISDGFEIKNSEGGVLRKVGDKWVMTQEYTDPLQAVRGFLTRGKSVV